MLSRRGFLGALAGVAGAVLTGATSVLKLDSGSPKLPGLLRDPNGHPKWRNYTAQYTDVSKDELIQKMREAHKACEFQPPHPDDPFWQRYDGETEFGIGYWLKDEQCSQT